MRRKHLSPVALLLVILFFAVKLNTGFAQPPELLVDAGSQPRSTLPAQVGTERLRFVTLNFDALAARSSSELILNLFDDVRYTAVNTRIEPRMMGQAGYIWIGTLRDVPYSNVILVVGDGIVSGRIIIPGRNYYIAPTVTQGLHTVSEINTLLQRPTPETDDAVPIEPLQDSFPPLAGRAADDGSVIDVMVVYTPAALAFVGNETNMQASIEGMVTLANITYENSLITFRLRLVHTAQIAYTEAVSSGSISTDLSRFSGNGDGYMDDVHQWRNTYAADLVTLIAGTPVAQRKYCGIAHLPGAFSIVEALCISDITYAHELGHNMGSAHDRPNAGGSGARTYYAYGYQDPRQGFNDWGDFVTVMAYSTGGQCPPSYQPGICPAIAYWSNPNQTFNGKPLGYPDTDPILHGNTATHNRRSLNEIALTVANYRVSQDGGAATQTPVPTATYTPYAPTPYLPTATPFGGTELLLNGSFEIDADNDRLPDGWAGRFLSRDLRVCKNAYHGKCVYRVLGVSGERSKLVQAVLEPGRVNIGDILTLTGYVRSTSITSGARLELIVTYTDHPLERLVMPVAPNLNTYTLLSGELVAKGQITGIRVIVRYNNSSATGRFFVDRLSLKWDSP